MGAALKGVRWTDAYDGAGKQVMQRGDALETKERKSCSRCLSLLLTETRMRATSHHTQCLISPCDGTHQRFSFLIGLLEPAVETSGVCWDPAAAVQYNFRGLSFRYVVEIKAIEGSSDMLSNSFAWLSVQFLRFVSSQKQHSLPFGRSFPVLSFQNLWNTKYSNGGV